MSDINVRLRLNENASTGFKKVSSAAQTAAKSMQSFSDIGKRIDSVLSQAAKSVSSFGDEMSDLDMPQADFGWLDTFSSKMESASKTLEEFDRKISGLSSNMPDYDSTGLGGLSDDLDGAADSMARLDSRAGSLTSTIKGLVAAVASYVAIDKAIDFGLDTLEVSANQQAMESQFSQVFGSLESTASGSLASIAADTGILENRLEESYTQIAAYAKTTGMDTADAMALSDRAMVAVADSAAFYDRTLEETTESLQSYLKGNYENDAALGLSSTEYTRNAAALKLYNKEFQDLSESQKQLTLLQMVEDANKLSGAIGQAARESETWSNQTGNLAQKWEDMKASMGDQILDEAVDGIGVLIDNMDEMEEPLVDLFSVIGDLISDIVPMIPGAIRTLTNGLKSLGSVIGPLFDGVKENPGLIGDVITSIGASALTYKVATNLPSVVSGISSLWGVISSNPWAVGATAVVGSIAAISTAVDYYNKLTVDANLDAHFGDIDLSAAQVEEFAGNIIPMDIAAQLQIANVTFDEAESLISQAEDLISENDYINWKVNTVQLEMTSDDASTLIQNTDQFVESVETAIEKESYSAQLTVKTLLGEVESADLISEMQTWFAEDMATVSTLGDAVTDLLQKSIDEGAYNINTQTAIEIMQMKMLDIASGARQAELQGKIDWLDINSAGAALTAESWASVVETLEEYRQEQKDVDEEAYQKLLGYFRLAEENGHITEQEMESLKDMIRQAVDQQEAYSLASSWEYISGSMGEAYGEELGTLNDAMGDADFTDLIMGTDALYGANLTFAEENVRNALDEAFKGMDKGTQDALADRYKTIQSTVEDMGEMISQAAKEGAAVPEALMESYTEAVKMGAAAGDYDAMWQYMAIQVASDYPSMDDFLSTLESNGVDFTSWPDAVQESFRRAFTETDPNVDFAGMLTELISAASQNEDFDWAVINSLLEKYGLSISKGLEEQGVDVDAKTPLNTDDLTVDVAKLAKSLEGLTAEALTAAGDVEYTVQSGDTLWSYAEQIAPDPSQINSLIDQIMELNPHLEDRNEIQVGDTLILPGEYVLEEGAAEQAAAAAGEAADQVRQEAQNAAEAATSEPLEADQSTYVNNEIEGTNADEVYEEAGTELNNAFETPMEVNGSSDVTADRVSDNFSEVYSQAKNDLQSIFNSVMPINASASIHVDYSIANPSATISFGGGGTGSTTVSASVAKHGLGGLFDEPHFGIVAEAGPEYIIPMNDSDESREMVREASAMLGMDDSDESLPEPPSFSGNGESTGSADSKTINLNINGSGSIGSGGMRKEEVLQILMDNVKGILMDILQEDIFVEGDGAYEY